MREKSRIFVSTVKKTFFGGLSVVVTPPAPPTIVTSVPAKNKIYKSTFFTRWFHVNKTPPRFFFTRVFDSVAARLSISLSASVGSRHQVFL